MTPAFFIAAVFIAAVFIAAFPSPGVRRFAQSGAQPCASRKRPFLPTCED